MAPARAAYRSVRRMAPHPDAPSPCEVRAAGVGNRIDCSNSPNPRRATVTVEGDNNVVVFNHDAHILGLTITITGSGNCVSIAAATVVDSELHLTGSGNAVTIGTDCVIRNGCFVCEDDDNLIEIGEATEFAGSTELAVIEGTAISIAERCLFSGGVHVRTGDSHAVTDLDGVRINYSADICIADHVWIGRNVTILKGVSIAESCVVGASAVVTKQFDEPHCAIAGNPARVVRHDIDWRTERGAQA